MMKCNKCGATLLLEQVPEVHISEAEVNCNQPGCDGTATYRNNRNLQILMEAEQNPEQGGGGGNG